MATNLLSHRYEGTGTAMSEAHILDSATDCQIVSARLHLNASNAVSDIFTVTVTCAADTDYATVLDSIKKDMNGLTDYEGPNSGYLGPVIPKGDTVTFAWSNAGAKNWFLEVIIRAV